MQTYCHDPLHTLCFVHICKALENEPTSNMTNPTGELFNEDEKVKKDLFKKFRQECFFLKMMAKYLTPALYLLFIIIYFAFFMNF